MSMTLISDRDRFGCSTKAATPNATHTEYYGKTKKSIVWR